MSFSLEKFKRKQDNLFAALERAKTILDKNVKLLPSWPYDWDFNLQYDLITRLENRIHDLQSEYYDWHWDKYDFNGYDV
jgi:hypothetical protein